MKRLSLLSILVVCALPWPGVAQTLPGGLAPSPDEASSVVAISDGDTLTLGSGQIVRLVGLQAPKLPLGRPGFEKWPLADEAKAYLETLVRDAVLLPAYGGAHRDRHGRALAHLFRMEDGLWVQRAMLEAGFARVYSFADNRAAIAPLLEAERTARAARKGIWAHPYYAIRTARGLARHMGRSGQFHLVEGRVTGVAHFRDQSFVNFGADYKTDFTVVVEARDRGRFGTGDDLAADAGRIGEAWLSGLDGKTVRVRGWVFFRNGPAIKLTHPEQIELLE